MTSNMYMKFENPSIDGSSKAPGHAREIEVLSFSQGSDRPGRAGQPTLSFTNYVDDAAHALLHFSFSGKQIGKATLSWYREGGPDGEEILYFQIVMERVVISNYGVSGGQVDLPVETVTLDYETARQSYDSKRE